MSTIIWLGDGVINDETDGHIDNLACFARPGEVCLTFPANRRDAQWRVSQDALERLRDARDARGRRLKIHKLPSPGPLKMTRAEAAGVQSREGVKPRRAGERLAASYANFYIANGGVIMPLLDPRTDKAALAKLRRVFPERKVVGVPGREILLGGGNIHCITQQVPRARQCAAQGIDHRVEGRAGAHGRGALGRVRVVVAAHVHRIVPAPNSVPSRSSLRRASAVRQRA